MAVIGDDVFQYYYHRGRGKDRTLHLWQMGEEGRVLGLALVLGRVALPGIVLEQRGCRYRINGGWIMIRCWEGRLPLKTAPEDLPFVWFPPVLTLKRRV